MTETVAIDLTVNGQPHALNVPANLMLIDLLREHLHLSGTKLACDQGACGACTVLLDGMPVTACLTFAFVAEGRAVDTIEGVASADGAFDRVQRAFHESGVPQCGFCTPGMVMLTRSLLAFDGAPDPESIDRWLGANICRCSGYQVFRRALAPTEGDSIQT